MKKHVTFVLPLEESNELLNLVYDMKIDVTRVKSLPELYPLLFNSNFRTDMIILDIRMLYDQPNVNCFCIIETFLTLIRMYQEDRRIVVGISACVNTDPYQLREIYGTQINGFIPYGRGTQLEEKYTAINDIMAGNRHLPKKISFLMNNTKKYAKIVNEDLTFRQKQIYTLIREQGLCNKSIARLLNISESAVKAHLGRVFKKYDVKNRTQLALVNR